MAKPQVSLEQQRIRELERALEVSMWWLLVAQDRPDDWRAFDSIREFLCNHGIKPRSKEAKALLKRCPEAYHHEIEKAVKRGVGK